MQQAVAGAAAAIAAGDLDRLATAFAELSEWDDRHRAYQARCGIVEAVLAYQPASSDGWVGPFFTAAEALLDALEAEPREPALLNHAGVFLYELLEAAAAEDLFKAALRLDPSQPFAAQNLEQAKIRKRSPSRLKGAFGARMRGLAARGRKVAAQARPVAGLRLSLCMIVKDEEEMLAGCLEPLRGVVDEMVVVDTGSTDRTVEIAESFGAKVVHFPWNGSFADARNVSLDNATGDWIMYLDADEHIEAEDAPKLRDLLGRTWREGFNLVETNYTGGEDTGSATTHLALRLWRRRPEYRFEGRIHEQKTHTMPMFPARAVRDDDHPRPPLRLPEPADRLQGEVAAEHRAARAGGAREPEPVQRLQPRLGVPGARRRGQGPHATSTGHGSRCGRFRAWPPPGTCRSSSPAPPAPAARPATTRRPAGRRRGPRDLPRSHRPRHGGGPLGA